MSDTLNYIGEKIATNIKDLLNHLCVHYRLHWRAKDLDSLRTKIEIKCKTNGKDYYSKNGRKVQDILGFRITTYFYDDVKVLWEIFHEVFDVVDEEYDMEQSTVFEPLRKNMVCRMPPKLALLHHDLCQKDNDYALTDATYEIQFRTTLSEGWHEIDHALRYKCKTDWDKHEDEERAFNGIFAALEANDRMLKSLFDDLAYDHYKHEKWEALLRTKFRLHFCNTPPFSLSNILKDHHEWAKSIIRCDRNTLLKRMVKNRLFVPMTYDNLFWMIMYFEEPKDKELRKLIPKRLIEDWDMKTNAI